MDGQTASARRLAGPDSFNHLTRQVLDAAMKVHSHFGAGLLERIYRDALATELRRRGHRVDVEVPVQVWYEGEPLGEALRMDLLVEDEVVV